MKTSIEVITRSTEIDIMGHVNNAVYLEYMEWSREDWYNQIGLPFDTFSKLGIGTVTANINIDYVKELRLGESITISTEPIRRGRSSFVLKHEIHNQKDELVATALATCVTIDLNKRKSIPMPQEVTRQFPAQEEASC
jgi:thioesterase-3